MPGSSLGSGSSCSFVDIEPSACAEAFSIPASTSFFCLFSLEQWIVEMDCHQWIRGHSGDGDFTPRYISHSILLFAPLYVYDMICYSLFLITSACFLWVWHWTFACSICASFGLDLPLLYLYIPLPIIVFTCFLLTFIPMDIPKVFVSLCTFYLH